MHGHSREPGYHAVSGMKAQRQKYRAAFGDGDDGDRIVEVNVDQRDISALERNRGKGYDEIPTIEGVRWAVWHAGKRSMLAGWPQTLEEFERTCWAVEPVEAPEVANPTEPVPEGG